MMRVWLSEICDPFSRKRRWGDGEIAQSVVDKLLDFHCFFVF